MITNQDVILWQKSMPMVSDRYQPTRLFPKKEIYGLTAQIREDVPYPFPGIGLKDMGDMLPRVI
jgi:hypothetical protein